MPNDSPGFSAEVRTVCDLVRSTIGPLGGSKLILEQTGTVTTTSVGSIVLERVDVESPSMTLLERTASDFRARHGDGSSSVVVLTGEVLKAADDLIELGLHPTTIERGYREALEVAADRLDHRSHPLSEFGLEAVGRTALTSLRDPGMRDRLSDDLARMATELSEAHGAAAFDRGRVGVVSRTGGPLAETDHVRPSDPSGTARRDRGVGEDAQDRRHRRRGDRPQVRAARQ